MRVFIQTILLLISVSAMAEPPKVKKSKSGICHDQTSRYYKRVKHFTAYETTAACIESGGREPKNRKKKKGGAK